VRALLGAVLLSLAAGGAAADSLDSRAAVLQGLDKVTARVSRIEAPIGQTVEFGRLRITARACRKRPPEEPPESAAYLEIDDVHPDGQVKRVYAGWMFASSPAVAAMEHPVYDVWVIDCLAGEPPPATPPAPARPQPPARSGGTAPR
jgi:hypothetical protein